MIQLKQTYILIVLLLFIISSCCDEKKKYSYVSENCNYINYREAIELSDTVSVSNCKIQVLNKENNIEISSFNITEKNIQKWHNNSTKISLPKSLATNKNWRIIINDSLIYTITDINVEVWGGKTMSCEQFSCVIKNYKVNNTLVKNKHIIKI